MKEYVKVNLNNNQNKDKSQINCIKVGFIAEGLVGEIELFKETFTQEEALNHFIKENNYNHDGLIVKKVPIYEGVTVYAEKLNNDTVKEIITDRIIRRGDELSGYLSFSSIQRVNPNDVVSEYKRVTSSDISLKDNMLTYARTLSQIEKISIEKFEEANQLMDKTAEEKADIMIKNLIVKSKRK